MSAVLSEARRGADARADEYAVKVEPPKEAPVGEHVAAKAARAAAPAAAASVAARVQGEEAAEAAEKAAYAARDAADKLLSPVERLELSRARIRLELLDIAFPERNAPPRSSGLLDDWKATLGRLLQNVPGASLITETIGDWWNQHPLHTAGELAQTASRELLQPLARRNPTGLVLGAAALGALVILARPWRWALRPALFVGLVPQLLSHAMRRMPLESWVGMATKMMAPSRRRPAPRQSSGSKTSPAASAPPADT